MAHRIKLDYFLKKTRISLKGFCEKNSLKSYDELLEYCLSKGFAVVSKKEYESTFPPKPLKKEKVVEAVKIDSDQSKPEKKIRKRRSRKKSSDSESGNTDPSI